MNDHQTIRCPEENELGAFSIGDLPDSRMDQLAEHVENCKPCGIIVDDLSKQDQSGLMAELRTMNCKPVGPGETAGLRKSVGLRNGSANSNGIVPKELMTAVQERACDPSAPVSFDVGKRLANRLQNGPVRIGRFELKSELGVGSFGYVFKARDTKLDRLVALKVQRAGTFATEEDVDRFLREAQSVAQLNHAGIVSVYDSVRSSEDVCYLVTEYIQGESLEAKLLDGEYSNKESARLIAEISDAIQYAHDNGIVHRDIKPSNILLDEDGNPHVMDFGLAKRTRDAGNAMTSIGRVLGTPAYMSPEQAAGDSNRVGTRSDIYSLGVVLYEMLTGERPFQGNRRMLLLQVMDAEPRSPRQLQANVPLDLETICLKALSKSPSRRYQSAGEMANDLRRYLQCQPIKARPLGTTEKLWRWCRAYPLAASLLIAIPMMSIGGFAYLSSLSTNFVHSTALESTRMEANMLEDINEYYSEQVVGPLDRKRVPVTHQYMGTPNSVPLPFTFMIDAGKHISDGESGMQVRIFSDYPWRENSGPIDDFELRSIQALGLGCRTDGGSVGGLSKNDPGGHASDARTSTKADVDGRSYYEFDELKEGPVLRYARAQIMKQSCIDCHNNDESSPKRDWIVGEVAGVLSITRPLKRDIETTRTGLRSAFVLIGCVATLLTGLTLGLFWSAKRRSSDYKGASSDGNH